ncbi:MAG: hypothetical protein AABY22_24455, partial [Nanoarchaeota archaeon]
MTALSRPILPKKTNANVCDICKFPSGRYRNNNTGEVRRVSYFRKASDGKYICNVCVEEHRGIPVKKMNKKENKQWKKMKRGLK